MNLIIDKNYLIGASKDKINKLLSEHTIFMSDTLFMEILTADNESHIKKCFCKFPQSENPITLLQNASSLLSFERKNHKPCGVIENYIWDIRYEFNPDLQNDRYNIIVKHVEQPIKEFKEKLSKKALGFSQKAFTVSGWFPELKDKAKITKKEKDAAIKKVAEDLNFIRKVYAKIQKGIFENENEQWPNPKAINKDWALFRYFQFHLMGTLELFWRQTQDNKKIMNAYLDMDYCILGSIADGIVTRDNTMAYFFRMACPEKIVLN